MSIAAATHNDGLRLQLSGSDVVSMRAVNTIPGVVLLAASATNGPGLGTLAAGALGLSWMAPGSTTPGTPQICSPDGAYILEDGEDPTMWVRVQVYNSYLGTSGQSLVYISDSYDPLGLGDVTAANASAGVTTIVEFTLKNVSPSTITGVLLWMDSSVIDLSVSSDGTNYYTPTSSTDSHVLSWASISAGASVNLWVKRIIPSSSASNAGVLNWLHYSWNGF